MDLHGPDALLLKFRKFWRHKITRREGLRPEDPLFCSQSRTRISPRRVQFAFRTWQVEAGFDRLYPFHSLGHQAATELLDRGATLNDVRDFLRHKTMSMTLRYGHLLKGRRASTAALLDQPAPGAEDEPKAGSGRSGADD